MNKITLLTAVNSAPDKNKVFWYSRHALSQEQLAEITDAQEEFSLWQYDAGDITEENEWEKVTEFLSMARGAKAVYGVFPSVILEAMFFNTSPAGAWCYASFNEMRSTENGPKTHKHNSFRIVGRV